MILARIIDVQVRLPIRVQRVTGWYCVRCDAHHKPGDGRCPTCLRPLRRIFW